ncbi:MAG: hypothetical protein M3494_06905 [Actinomycetota bacterium]|nr:hypothetical protein [Actinomycetota bacterium]
MTLIYAAGPQAFARIEDGGMSVSLENTGARAISTDPSDPDIVYVGTDDDGVFKSSDGGSNFDRLSGSFHPRITSLAVSPVDRAVYAGTEPSSLFASRDGGDSWRELEGLKNLPSAPTWSFPPRPWTSHVRAIALSHTDPSLIVAGIELGGIVRSADSGETWQDQRPGAVADCHSLATHPEASNTVFEAGGTGFAESGDFGESWRQSTDGLEMRYAWGLAVSPEDPERIYISAASGPMRAHGEGFTDAAIYERRSGAWTPILEHLREFPYALATDSSGSLYAGFGDGGIHVKENGSWREVARIPGGLDAMVVT